MKTADAVSKLESSGYHIREADDIDDSNYDYDSTSYMATVLINESYEPHDFASIEILQNENLENRIFCYTDSANYNLFLKDLKIHKFKQVLEVLEDPNEKIYRNSEYEISIAVVSDYTIRIGIFNFRQTLKI
jgi:hypothetical protein